MGAVAEAHMKARIVRTGKSQGIRLPKALLKKAKLGGEVELRAEPGRILISNTGKPRVGWGSKPPSACGHETKIVSSMQQVQHGSIRKTARRWLLPNHPVSHLHRTYLEALECLWVLACQFRH